MQKILLFILAFFLIQVSCYPKFREIGIIKCPHAGFLTLGKTNPNQLGYDFYISSFDGIPFTQDQVYVVNNIGSDYNNISSIIPKEIVSVTWPNRVQIVPKEVGFKDSYVSISSGFLVPFKSTGGVYLLDMSENQGNPIKISTDKDGWFYHQIRWFDVNNDGMLDILTSRAHKGILSSGEGELVWMQNPGANIPPSQWNESVLISGPDVFFSLIKDQNNQTFLIAAQFFTQQLSLYWSDNLDWTKGKLNKRIIDGTIGPIFDVTFCDVNNDGKNDLLVTNNIDVEGVSGVFVYETPDDFKTQVWTKHVLIQGIKTRSSGPGSGSPGFGRLLQPATNSTSKPLILLAGDNSEEAYIIEPLSQDPNNWSYSKNVILVANDTVGEIVIGDINNDGYNEFFIPLYEKGMIYTYTFSP